MIKLFFDVETTGLDHRRSSIHQVAGLVEVDEIVKESFDIRMAPRPKAVIEDIALRVGGVTLADILFYDSQEDGLKLFRSILEKYVDRYDPTSKAYLAGFNNAKFDNEFLLAWFKQCGDNYFMSWFWPEPLDVITLAGEYLMDRRKAMPSFKLKRVAMELGLYVDEGRLHDGVYDCELTRSVYRVVTGRDIEL